MPERAPTFMIKLEHPVRLAGCGAGDRAGGDDAVNVLLERLAGVAARRYWIFIIA
jgi:hypothetical protein